MENFDTIIATTEKSLHNIRVSFDKENIRDKIKELENISFKRQFLER